MYHWRHSGKEREAIALFLFIFVGKVFRKRARGSMQKMGSKRFPVFVLCGFVW